MSDFFYEHCITRFLARILRSLNFHWICLSNSDVTLPDFGNFFYNWETSLTKFCRRYLSLRCSRDGKVGEISNKKSIRKHGKAQENSGSRLIFPKFIFQKKNRYHRENLKQKLRVLQFCTLTLPSWLFLRKKLRYCINLIFYHSFFQNYTIIIAVLIFEKKHGSYRVYLCEWKLRQNPTQWCFFFEYIAETNPIAILDENGFITTKGCFF